MAKKPEIDSEVVVPVVEPKTSVEPMDLIPPITAKPPETKKPDDVKYLTETEVSALITAAVKELKPLNQIIEGTAPTGTTPVKQRDFIEELGDLI